MFALLMAGSLLVPHIGPAFGNDRLSAPRAEPDIVSRWDALLRDRSDQVPWLHWGISRSAPKGDVMIGPKIDTLGPFLLQPAQPTTLFSSTWKYGPDVRTE
jgi:hypothetical protein